MLRALLLDVFGTLVVPRTPVHRQYVHVARDHGLVIDSDDDFKDAFVAAFRQTSREHPLYGYRSVPPLNPDTWWALVIERAFERSGVAGSDLHTTLPTLIPSLLNHFSSKNAYYAPPDVIPALGRLKSKFPNLHLGICTNSDARIIKAVCDLDIVPHFIPNENITTSWETKISKPDKNMFLQAVKKIDPGIQPHECLHVGDHLTEDYKGAQNAGFNALLLDRHLNSKQQSLQNNLLTISSLQDIPEWISKYNSSQG